MPSAANKQAAGVVGKSEYAAMCGYSPAYISKLIKLGMLAPPALTPDGRIDVALADQMLGQRPGADRPEMTAQTTLADIAGDAPVYAIERARREKAQAALAELDLAQRQGRLIDTDAVRTAARVVFERASARIMDGFADLAIDIARVTDPARITDILSDHLRRNLRAIHEEFMEDATRRSGN